MINEERYFTLSERDLNEAVTQYLGYKGIIVSEVEVNNFLNGSSPEKVLFTDVKFKEVR